MRKSLLICLIGVTVLTGCTSETTKGVYDKATGAYVKEITNQHPEKIVDINTNKWEQSIIELNKCDTDSESYNYYSNYEYDGTYGVYNDTEIIEIPDIKSEEAKNLISCFEKTQGIDLKNLLEEAENLEEGKMVENIYGETGVGIVMQGEILSLYAMTSGISVKDNTKSEWLKEICGQQLIISAVSEGEEKQLYELSTIASIINDTSGEYINTPYLRYDIICDDSGKIEKVNVIVKSYLYTDENQNQEVINKLEPLKRLVTSLNHEEAYQDVADKIINVYSGKTAKASGNKNGCKVDVRNININNNVYNQVIMATITF